MNTEKRIEKLDNKWENLNNKQKNGVFIVIYSIVFIITLIFSFGTLILNNQSLVNSVDGRLEYFPLLTYLGRSIRKVLLSALNGDFSIPLFDINMGLGEDIISFPASLGMLDPLAVILTPLFPAKYTELLYNFLAYFYLYLSGLSFYYFCIQYKKRRSFILIGSIVYCFTGFEMSWLPVGFSFFTLGLVQLPLVLAGAKKIIEGDKPYVYIFSVFWTAVCKYFTLYIIAICTGIFALVSTLIGQRKNKAVALKSALSNSFKVCGKLLGYACIAVGLAGVVFFPAIWGLIGSSRSGVVKIPDPNSLNHIRDLLLRFFIRGGGEYLGTAAIVLFAITAMILSEKKRPRLILLTVVSIICYFSSFAGWIFSGMQYASNRWIFVLSLVIAFAVVEMSPELLDLSRRQWYGCILIILAYSFFVFYNIYHGVDSYALVSVSFIGITWAALGVGVFSSGNGKRCTTLVRLAILLAVIICNVGTIGYWLFSSAHDNTLGNLHESGFETERLENATERYMESYLLDNPVGRADGTNFYRNTGMVWRIPTALMSYNSVVNDNIIDFWTSIDLSTRNQRFNHYSTDHRTIPLTLLSVKYYVAPNSSDADVPYGYYKIDTKEEYNIYENSYALPWGYTYEKATSYEYLDSLNGLEKQNVMLQAIAIEDGENLPDLTGEYPIAEIPFEIVCKNCKWENGVLTVSKENATITLSFEAIKDTESYLYLTDFDLDGLSSFGLKVACNGKIDNTGKTNNRELWYVGIKNYLYNLGSKSEGKTTVTLTISYKGKYKLGNIQMYRQDLTSYIENVEALREEPLENIRWGSNTLTGTVDLSKDKILCVSVPYSKGWSATVDGEKADILCGNYMFMCLPLAAGHHDIEFHYCSPGLKLGVVVSCISIAVLIGMVIHKKKGVERRT